jgi:hypothetical protein
MVSGSSESCTPGSSRCSASICAGKIFRPRMKGLRCLLHIAVFARVSLAMGGESEARLGRDDNIVAG